MCSTHNNWCVTKTPTNLQCTCVNKLCHSGWMVLKLIIKVLIYKMPFCIKYKLQNSATMSFNEKSIILYPWFSICYCICIFCIFLINVTKPPWAWHYTKTPFQLQASCKCKQHPDVDCWQHQRQTSAHAPNLSEQATPVNKQRKKTWINTQSN